MKEIKTNNSSMYEMRKIKIKIKWKKEKSI